jgi:hypothetical protein
MEPEIAVLNSHTWTSVLKQGYVMLPRLIKPRFSPARLDNFLRESSHFLLCEHYVSECTLLRSGVDFILYHFADNALVQPCFYSRALLFKGSNIIRGIIYPLLVYILSSRSSESRNFLGRSKSVSPLHSHRFFF